jgi:hypothetical protein
MKPIKTYVKLRRTLRYLDRRIKNCRNEAKAYRDESAYHRTVIDHIEEMYTFKDIEEQK